MQKNRQGYVQNWYKGVVLLFVWQFAGGVVVAVFLLLWQDWLMAVAAFYGVLLIIANGAWLAIEIKTATAMTADVVNGGEQVLYRSAAQRFIAMLLALVLAWWFGLHLLMVASGLLVAHLAAFGYSMYAAYTETEEEERG